MSDFKCIGAKECFLNGVYSRSLILQHQDGSTEELTFEPDRQFVIYDGQLLDWWGRQLFIQNGIARVRKYYRITAAGASIFLVETSSNKLALAKVSPSSVSVKDDFVLPLYPKLPSKQLYLLEIITDDFNSIDKIAETPITELLVERFNTYSYTICFLEGYDGDPDIHCYAAILYSFESSTEYRCYHHYVSPSKEETLELIAKAKSWERAFLKKEKFYPKTITASEDGTRLIATYIDAAGKRQKAYMDMEIVRSLKIDNTCYKTLYWAKLD